MEDRRLAQRKRNFPRLCPPQKNRNIREIYDIIRTRLLCGSFSTFRRWRKKVARNTRGGAERSLSRSLSVPMAKLGEEVPLGRQKKNDLLFHPKRRKPSTQSMAVAIFVQEERVCLPTMGVFPLLSAWRPFNGINGINT